MNGVCAGRHEQECFVRIGDLIVYVKLRSAVEERVGVVKASVNNGTANGVRCIKIKGFTDMSEGTDVKEK